MILLRDNPQKFFENLSVLNREYDQYISHGSSKVSFSYNHNALSIKYASDNLNKYKVYLRNALNANDLSFIQDIDESTLLNLFININTNIHVENHQNNTFRVVQKKLISKHDTLSSKSIELLYNLGLSALVHDIGKNDPEILSTVLSSKKIDANDISGRKIIEKHPYISFEYMSELNDDHFGIAKYFSLLHHFIGKGYPNIELPIVKEGINFVTNFDLIDDLKSLNEADVFSALTEKRSYLNTKSVNDILRILELESKSINNSEYLNIFR